MPGRHGGMGGPEDLPRPERPEWQDVTPLPQVDGPEPLAVIRYPPGFVETHDYFRAIQAKEEYSHRALELTADVIEHNSANYTAWYYRRKCLKALGADLDQEMEFTDNWARDAPKNYQVWYHRRWLITEITDRLRADGPAGEAKVCAIGERELEYHLDVMQVNDDYKNYNGWSHRQFIVQKFNLWDREMSFVEDLLRDDIRNNSAWNHRFTVVKNTVWPLSDETRQREINYALEALRQCAMNESAWNYLSAFLGEGECKAPWDSVPAVEALCNEVLALAPAQKQQCRFAVEAVAQICEARGDADGAAERYALLQELDKVREKYWEWRAAVLKHQRHGGA
ncbi:unnamed protein product [Prorocentrum cordatum]|uniref:Protein farnesyltransferase/geranylgeranyltransferase type-1 subunit alpha n=1 Tax=Prorocentrum cordatum TaxID=2364126 RepID=A0ABN9RTH3_9DINO|nr:unnamed protein product [Polarella glacialis]|mmetsp:Transcript_54206/g.141228  ORF Transcript_54206/g.141228 Transcript_54206/m.141228 type:complete len:339 (-) Transcript_54206:34-1050(-)